MSRAQFLPLLPSLLASWLAAPADAAPHPVAEPGSYQLHPALELSLFAREPDVVDPVALTFDELGRAYVVEMRDYPYGFGPERRPGGTIRLLEDTNGDGRADRSTLFADGLSFPTSITAWNGGVLVMAAPDLVFLRDDTGDGRADTREILLTGFRLGVTDSNANGLRWGLDNWLHGVNGGNGGALRSPRHPDRAAVELGQRDFRLRPDTGEVELTSETGGGFGLVFDEWGRSFTTHNINHLQQRVVDDDLLARFPGLPPIGTTHSISDHGDMARIYAISPAQTRPNHPEQAGHFSASGGMGYLGHAGWPAEVRASTLVGDVVGNLVHRDVLTEDGPILRGSRAPGEETAEFFASRDPAFRPVATEQGPDGAVYLLDMQRDVIEHPDYIPRKMLEKQDIRAGDDRGRIYRILPRDRAALRASLAAAGTADPDHPDRERLPGRATPEQLVTLLRSPNPWTRTTAQRLLAAQPPGGRESAVRAILVDPATAAPALAPARVHALAVLAAWKALDEATLLTVLADPTPGVRVNALEWARTRLRESAELRASAVRRLDDPSAWVRFSAALALGDSGEFPVAGYVELLRRDGSHRWSRRAVLASVDAAAAGRILAGVLADDGMATATRGGAVDVVREVTARAFSGSTDDAREVLRRWRERAASSPPLSVTVVTAALEGLSAGLGRTGRRDLPADEVAPLLQPWLGQGTDSAALAAAWRVARQLELPDTENQRQALAEARRVAMDRTAPLDRRVAAIRLLDFGTFADTAPVLIGLLDGTKPAEVQQAAFGVLREHREVSVAQGLIDAWPALAPALRPSVVNLLVYRSAFHGALLDALEQERLRVGELNLDLEQRRQLLRHSAPSIRERAARFTSDEEYSNRSKVAEDWLARLPATGDAPRGRVVFERLCATCHRSGALGFDVGPDLSGMSHRSVEDLVSNILDPNMAMNPAYVAFTAELQDGEQETGIRQAETADSITLLQAGGRRVELARSQLRQLRSGGKSLMPEGLEAGLSPQDLRDLVAFLQLPAAPPPPANAGGAP